MASADWAVGAPQVGALAEGMTDPVQLAGVFKGFVKMEVPNDKVNDFSGQLVKPQQLPLDRVPSHSAFQRLQLSSPLLPAAASTSRALPAGD